MLIFGISGLLIGKISLPVEDVCRFHAQHFAFFSVVFSSSDFLSLWTPPPSPTDDLGQSVDFFWDYGVVCVDCPIFHGRFSVPSCAPFFVVVWPRFAPV